MGTESLFLCAERSCAFGHLPDILLLFFSPQGRVIPCDFIGLVKSQQSVYLKVSARLQRSEDSLASGKAIMGSCGLHTAVV